MVSIDTIKLTVFFGSAILMIKNSESKRVEAEFDVYTYLDGLKYSIKAGNAKLQFQQDRAVDSMRDERFTNRFTVANLFPNDDPVDALKRELLKLEVEHYIETVKDTKFPKKAEMRVFGMRYSDDVYIKIRVELMKSDMSGINNGVFVMSFHYAEHPFTANQFPYKKAGV